MSGELDLKRVSPSSEREGVTCPQHHPSESRTTPACCACGGLSPNRDCSSPSVTVCGTFAQEKTGFETREKVTHWGHPKGSHRGDQVLGFYRDTNLSQWKPGQGTGLLWASLASQRADRQIAVNTLEICSLFDTCPISLINTASPSREALAASDIGS